MFKKMLVFFCVLLLGSSAPFALAGMSSVNYQINWDSADAGGDQSAASSNYRIQDTIDGQVVGTSTSANYQLSAGYRLNDGSSDVISFSVLSQREAIKFVYSSVDFNTKTVQTNGAGFFSIGDYVAIIENRGLSQKVAYGRVVLSGITSFVLGSLSGQYASMSSHSTDGDDYVYAIRNQDGVSAVSFGHVSQDSGATSLGLTFVTSTVPTGYTLYVQANQPLTNGTGDVIANVADGLVSLGSEEYGFNVTGTRAVTPDVDRPLTANPTAIQSSASAASSAETVLVTYRLSVTNQTKTGDYSQLLYYTLTANY